MPDIFDEHDYVGYPMTIGIMVRELKKIIDDYQDKKLTNEEIKTILRFYAETSTNKIFKDDKLNITVQRKIGQFRIEVLEAIYKELGFL